MAEKASRAMDHLDALGSQSFDRVVGLDPALSAVHVRHHASEVDLGLDGGKPDAVGGPHAMRELGRREQALAGHAPRPQAIATGL
jgi:hypothetical protein